MGSLVQFVCFTTVMPQNEFLVAWEPFASAFLSRGIERIVLSEHSERASEAAFDFVSRNVWDEQRFERAFPHGVRGSGGLGPIGVLQAGAFRLADAINCDPTAGQRADAKVTAFLMSRQGMREQARVAVRTALQQQGISGVAIYLKDGDARTDRFDMVVEVFCQEGSTDAAITAIRTVTAPLVTAQPVIIGLYQECAEIGIVAKKA
jgi:hypothetical protein